jgi:hypothetical protein
VNISDRKGKFKFGIFPQADTTWSNEDIIQAGRDIIRRNPIYSLVGYNCQSFVNDLVEAISVRNLGNTVKQMIRRWIPGLKSFLYRGEDDENAGEPIDPVDEALAEIKYLTALGETFQSAGSVVFTVEDDGKGPPDDVSDAGEIGPFVPADQPYVLTDETDALQLEGVGVVYGAVEDAAYNVSGIPVTAKGEDLTADQKAILGIAEALVGTEKK